ncbi:MAG: hypothetical protein ACE5KM_19480, partial [Planctomycetaceae bacterium]
AHVVPADIANPSAGMVTKVAVESDEYYVRALCYKDGDPIPAAPPAAAATLSISGQFRFEGCAPNAVGVDGTPAQVGAAANLYRLVVWGTRDDINDPTTVPTWNRGDQPYYGSIHLESFECCGGVVPPAPYAASKDGNAVG